MLCVPQIKSQAACSQIGLRASALRQKVLPSVQAQALAGQKMLGLSYDHTQERLNIQPDNAAKVWICVRARHLHASTRVMRCCSTAMIAPDEVCRLY
jgi:hypothetical protein